MVAFWFMEAWISVQALYFFYDGFSLVELVNYKGPAIWWTGLIIFCGMDCRRWGYISKFIYIATYLTSIIALILVASLTFNVRMQSYRTLFEFIQILLWLSPWVLFSSSSKKKKLDWVRIFPAIVLLFSTILVATRSWIILAMIYLLIYVFLNVRSKDGNKIVFSKIVKICFLGAVIGFTGFYLFQSQIISGFEILVNRIFNDTRSSQYVDFFSSISIKDLILGTGPRGVWTWGSRNYGSIDNAYLLMAFNGGIPLLIGYFFIVIMPGIRALIRKTFWSDEDLAASITIVVWGMALTGLSTYTMPSISITHFVIYLYAGRCLWALAIEKKNQRTNTADSVLRNGLTLSG